MKKLIKKLIGYAELNTKDPVVFGVFLPSDADAEAASAVSMVQIAKADHRLQKEALQKNLTLVLVSIIISSFSLVVALAAVVVSISTLWLKA